MRDEIERARTLSIPGLEEPPYFIQYVLDQEESFNVSASLGGLVTRRHDHFRSPDVRVRVGSYKFDNTNFAGGRGSGGSRYDLERFPTEDVYPLLRRYFWLETDSAYKSAVEAISRKRAALRNITQTDQLDDLAAAPPVHYLREIPKLTIDEDAWANRVRALSAIFENYPDLKTSGVDLDSSAGGAYIVNSEGAEVQLSRNRNRAARRRLRPGGRRNERTRRHRLPSAGPRAHALRRRNDARRECSGGTRAVPCQSAQGRRLQRPDPF